MQIKSINKLSRLIGIPRNVLEEYAAEANTHYSPFTYKQIKKDGSVKLRIIDNPDKSMRAIQKKINKTLLSPLCMELPKYMTGSIKGRSTKQNAAPHVGREALLLMDIQDCFPSINYGQVYDVYRNRIGCSPPVAKILAKLTTYRSKLPQGAPTSPSICNLVMEPMVKDLSTIAIKANVNFTQYVDDLTFSGTHKNLQSIRQAITKTVKSYGFRVNRSKTEEIRQSNSMRVTGLVVNRQVSVGRKYLRTVQRDILKNEDQTKSKGKISYVMSVSKSKSESLKKRLIKSRHG